MLRRFRLLRCWKVLAATALLTTVISPAHADWRDDIGTFRIGIVAEPGAGNTVPGLSALTRAYSMALGMKVEFLVAPDYATLIDAQAAGRVEYAIYSALAYAAASERCGCVEPLVAPTDDDGATGIRSILVARDGKVTAPQAMVGHRIAVGPTESIAGWLLPLAELASAQVSFSQASPFLERAPSASAAETMLVENKVDAIFGWTPSGSDNDAAAGGTTARLKEAGLPAGSLQVIWQSGLLRYGPHAVLKNLDPEAKRRLLVFLTNLKGQTPETYGLLEPRHSGGFVAVSHRDYAVAETILREVVQLEPKPGQASDEPAR
ncbi:MAG TPA: PhnD/SsuA/transferrin family substrate-binding protein [Mesorhizobium sp.]|jgi:phosphonate transport system substrate-binding protein|uniref:phosphate/phosphite/phosphonate ABC transporter substrate-binding protein n=1 Tax=Mesorhizobium sp. TaxID=1871066 RepID=UPI002DDCC479|nr:PhnD/SsuA/transferrin family substrate-binding protein [Mesorhizobium sp.]HEV2503009.1 PhnD/SsuA/transferrin family substrate-binding protein [Mesorhizobium sp.]